MNKKDQAREHAINYLSQAIESHERGDFLSVGDGFDEYDQMLPRQEISADDLLYITLEFWESWADTAEHTWEFYPPFTESDWPKLARILLEDLKANRKVTDKTILDHFVQKPRPPKRSLLERLKDLLSG